MDKLLQFGRRALFYIRVLSGYEERRIRSFRLGLDKRLKQVLWGWIFCFFFLFVLIMQFLLMGFSFYVLGYCSIVEVLAKVGDGQNEGRCKCLCRFVLGSGKFDLFEDSLI